MTQNVISITQAALVKTAVLLKHKSPSTLAVIGLSKWSHKEGEKHSWNIPVVMRRFNQADLGWCWASSAAHCDGCRIGADVLV